MILEQYGIPQKQGYVMVYINEHSLIKTEENAEGWKEEMRRLVRYRNGTCVRADFLRTMAGGDHRGMSSGLTCMVLRDLPRYVSGTYLGMREGDT